MIYQLDQARTGGHQKNKILCQEFSFGNAGDGEVSQNHDLEYYTFISRADKENFPWRGWGRRDWVAVDHG